MLAVQRFLRYFNDPKLLTEYYGIEVKTHKTYPNLLQLKYNMIDSPMSEQIVCESRGLILDSARNWNIVAFPLLKFFNYGEAYAAKIDWSSARALEKLDGSLMVLYWYDGKWHVASSGLPDARGPVGQGLQTFAELFWNTFDAMRFALPRQDQTHLTFMFELTSPLNRVVVPYTETKLTLIGVRNIETGAEESVYYYSQYNPVHTLAPASDIDTLLDSFVDKSGLMNEGYVVVDKHFNRIKVKHPGYVALHHLKGSLSSKRLVDIVRQGEASEFLTYFPEYTALYNSIKDSFDSFVYNVKATYASIQHIDDMKQFAQYATKYKYASILFALKRNWVKSPEEFLRTRNIKHTLEFLNLEAFDSISEGDCTSPE